MTVLTICVFGVFAGRGGQAQHDPRVPQPGGEGAARHMLGHTERSRQIPHTQLADRRVQSFLLQNEGKLYIYVYIYKISL